jgi:hypothetical protein
VCIKVRTLFRVIKACLLFCFGMIVILKGTAHILDSKKYDAIDYYSQCTTLAGQRQIDTEGAIFEPRENMNISVLGDNKYSIQLNFETSDKSKHTVVCNFEKDDISSFEVK